MMPGLKRLRGSKDCFTRVESAARAGGCGMKAETLARTASGAAHQRGMPCRQGGTDDRLTAIIRTCNRQPEQSAGPIKEV
jgi:hypothetical protein